MGAGRRSAVWCAALVAAWGGAGVARAVVCPHPLALVGSRPIGVPLYLHWRRIAKRASPRASALQLRRTTMSFLIQHEWLEGEARERGMRITARQVDAEFLRLRREAFHTEREFQRFLSSTGETVADLKFRVREDMLSARLQRTVVPADFIAKWRARTRCLPAYTVRECGGGTLPV